ncbi:hypothetical protein EST38_g10981 [Candolleomyces aberdarensis]|uniref:Integrase catalytic domain-containing protein n=1 Tax=Candolleomyces aberdarensis TaxID=2316362 RepID=A0A4Q2D612_9AGAR|nr:hypothetical protein EST38_g10981 [Candolleomyces aberdarensis]
MCEGDFEVFSSGGAWTVLIGKPLLEGFGAIHDYSTDTISIPKRGSKEVAVIRNQNEQYRAIAVEAGKRGQGEAKVGVAKAKVEEIEEEKTRLEEMKEDEGERRGMDNVAETVAVIHPVPTQELMKEARIAEDESVTGTEQPDVTRKFEPTVLTRNTEPFMPERVAAVLKEVSIGEDLTGEERQVVEGMIAEFADCFALSMSEVSVVEGAYHRLDIPKDAKFRTRVGQRPLTPPQKEFFNGVLDQMLEADVIEPIHYQDVKCCSATTLARKAHEGGGMTLEELQHRVNEECIAAGFPSAFDLPPRPQPSLDQDMAPTSALKTKWRVCQDFAELNKVTQVLPMPQGDIRAKQQNLAGHRWVSIFDFANGFYACEIRPEDRLYLCFYVEGRGYFAYKRMPFGLTGAPSTFAQMTARALGDLTGTLFELFVDDGGMAGDSFVEMVEKTRTLFQRIRETGLSLSASKSRFFMSEAVFAGGRVGKDGIKADLTKLTAIADWRRPEDLQNLGAFLGLAGYFRSLIKGYAAIAQPLTDLARKLSIDIPRTKGKRAYTRAVKGQPLGDAWNDEHTEAFLRLKVALTSEPVLKGPKYDGTPFIVTTDGCMYGFAGMVTQKSTTILPNGTEKTALHPISFVSKRTSPTEEKYKPFLLEFAALKYTLDKCADMLWGYPIEIETDCQALRDHLLNDKPNSTHARWRDGILAFNIVDVRHRPGRLNPVADGLSRKFVNLPKEKGDGHEWTVSEDWEARTGMEFDLFQVLDFQGVAASEEFSALRGRFKNERVFQEVVDAMLELDKGKSLRERKQARHRAKEYMIEDGRLWKVGSPKSIRARSRVECISQEEAEAMAWEVHRDGGHFHRDSIKAQLLDRIASPKLDQSITRAIMNCGKCKAFGSTHLHSLLQPITRRHPFELMAADTLSMPKGKGGYTKLGMYIDVYSQHVWVDKLKSAATGKTTVKAFGTICNLYTAPEALMTDGGPEFDNKELREECQKRGTKLHITPAYSPWVNGLIEGTNSRLLGILKRLCAPDIGEDEVDKMETPYDWPDHLETAVRNLNERILQSLKFSPNELLLGLVVNTPQTPMEDASAEVTPEDVSLQMAYVSQQHLDGYSQMVDHTHRRKEVFDRHVLSRAPKEVVFRAGDLVQVYRNDLEYTFKTERKLVPKFSAPRRVVSRNRNSYQLQSLEGMPLPGWYHARRLRLFIPRKGTELEKVQKELEDRWREMEDERDVAEYEKSNAEMGVEIDVDRRESTQDAEGRGGVEFEDGERDEVGGDSDLVGSPFERNEGVATPGVGTCGSEDR